MEKSSYGGIVTILFVCILAISCGAIVGSFHIGEDLSKQIIPTSVSTPADTINVIDEKDFQPENITVKLYIPKPVTKKPTPVKNYTNTTQNYTINNSNGNDNPGNNSVN